MNIFVMSMKKEEICRVCPLFNGGSCPHVNDGYECNVLAGRLNRLADAYTENPDCGGVTAVFYDRIRKQVVESINAQRKNAKTVWKKGVKNSVRAIVFDTETSGLYPMYNDILSLSWRVVNIPVGCKTESMHTCYFDWVSADRVTEEAIGINGLTRARLAELGTMSRKEGLLLFFEALRICDLAVAHNADFDQNFIIATARREGVNIPDWPSVFDTMKLSLNFCNIYNKDGHRKWPKLSELALALHIDDSDIDYHTSSADAELTSRCFAKMVEIAKG